MTHLRTEIRREKETIVEYIGNAKKTFEDGDSDTAVQWLMSTIRRIEKLSKMISEEAAEASRKKR